MNRFSTIKGGFVSPFTSSNISVICMRRDLLYSSKQASIKHIRSIQASKQAQDLISSKQAGGPQAWRLLACGHHCTGFRTQHAIYLHQLSRKMALMLSGTLASFYIVLLSAFVYTTTEVSAKCAENRLIVFVPLSHSCNFSIKRFRSLQWYHEQEWTNIIS